MDVLPTLIKPQDPAFAENREHMLGQLTELRARLAAVKAGGGEATVAKHRERGKLFVRDRIERLQCTDRSRNTFLDVTRRRLGEKR